MFLGCHSICRGAHVVFELEIDLWHNVAQRGTSRHFPGLSRIILAAVPGSPDSNWFGMEQDRWIQVVFKNMCPCALIWTTRD